MGRYLVVGVGLVERFIAHFQNGFLRLVGKRGVIGDFDIEFVRQGHQFLIGLGVVGNHMLGKGLHVRRAAFFKGQFARFHLGDTALGGIVHKVVGGRRHRGGHRACDQHEGKAHRFHQSSFHGVSPWKWRDAVT